MADSGRNLNLDSLTAERPTVTVRGQTYDMVHPGELGVRTAHRIFRWAKRIEALMQTEEPSEEQLDEVDKLMDRTCRAVLKAPPEIHDLLTDDQRLTIVSFFTELQRKFQGKAAGASEAAPTSAAPESPSTGTNGSPD